MARIPLADNEFTLGTVTAPAQRAVMPSAEGFGAGVAGEITRIGADGVQREQRAMLERQRRDEAEAEAAAQRRDAADRLTTAAELAQAREELRVGAEDLADQLRRGDLPSGGADDRWAETVQRIREERGGKVPQNLRGEFDRGLQQAMPASNAFVRRAQRDRDISDNRANLSTLLESLQRDAAAGKPGAVEMAATYLDELGGHAGYNEAEKQAIGQRFREGVAATVAMRAVNGARDDPRAVATARQTLQALPDLDPKAREQFNDRLAMFEDRHRAEADARARRADAAAAARMRNAEAEFRSGMALAQEGILNIDEAERRLEAMRGTPYQQAFRQMLEQQRKTGPLAAQPVASVRQALDALNAQIARGGITEELAQQRETLGKVAASQERDIASMGGLRAAAKRGVIVADQPLNFGAGMAAVGDQLRNRVLQADMVRGWAGSVQSPLYPEEAKNLATMLESSDPAGFGQAVGLLGSMVPAEQMAAIARQIDAKDKGLALALVAGSARTPEGRTVAEIIRRGSQAVKDKAPETRGAEATTLQEDLTKAIGDALPARLREDAIEASRLVYYGQKAAGRNVSVAGAVQLALGGPIIKHNGRPLPVPAGVDGYVLRDRLEAYPRADVERQAADGWILLAGARPMGVPEFLAELPNAQLEPAGRGRYTVRMGGSLALTKDRRPLVIEVAR